MKKAYRFRSLAMHCVLYIGPEASPFFLIVFYFLLFIFNFCVSSLFMIIFYILVNILWHGTHGFVSRGCASSP